MLSILGDGMKFVKIGDVSSNDSTNQQERALQAFLLRAVKNNHLSRDVYERIRPLGATRPRMYGLPKTQKPDVPLRPILSIYGWCTTARDGEVADRSFEARCG